ncbi:uncharacterized protein [Misgurnus anguillicaudatus]|uniref:uncharacterized protein n=1 Tax=Misgurnus anguillicaudatus TaxID=75329 RepID=UPI003CCF7F77
MSRKVEVVVNAPVHLEESTSPIYVTEAKPGDPPGVRGFLKINPASLGWLEILTGGLAFGLVFWNYERYLLIPACYLVLTGVVTATAACTRNSCLVVTSQILNFFNIISCVIVVVLFLMLFYIASTVRVFLAPSMTSWDIAFVVCNGLGSVLSLIIFSTTCCWCKSRKHVMIFHMNTIPPAVMNNVTCVDHPGAVPPAYYSPVPSSEPPAYEFEHRSSVSGPSAPVWDERRWKEELYRSRKPIQV